MNFQSGASRFLRLFGFRVPAIVAWRNGTRMRRQNAQVAIAGLGFWMTCLSCQAVAAPNGCQGVDSRKDGPSQAAVAPLATVGQISIQITSSLTVPVTVRLYQLKAASGFSTKSYAELLGDDCGRLHADLLSRSEIRLVPHATIDLSEPARQEARYVGVAVFLRNSGNVEWQVIVPWDMRKKTIPLKLALGPGGLELQSGAVPQGDP